MASGGVIVPPKGYQRRTWEVCRKYDVLYISDEVVTGFGRLGEIFASEPVFDIVPDIITSAKGLTSGYVPLGAFFVSDRLYDRLTGPEGKGKYFTNGFTYSAHPGGLRRGAEESGDHRAREHPATMCARTGPYFIERLKTLLDLPIVGDVRGSHMMVCVECVADKKTKQPMPAEWDVAYRIINHAMPRGLLVRPLEPYDRALAAADGDQGRYRPDRGDPERQHPRRGGRADARGALAQRRLRAALPGG